MYSFVIPAFNEEKNVELIYQRLLDLMKNKDRSFEIIFVDDGSRDNTKEKLTKLAKEDSRLKVICLSRNFGHQPALTAGLKYASGDAIISMDCDLQDPPEIIDQMIEKWKNGCDIVYARRLNYRKDNFIKKLASKFYYKILARMADIDIPRNVGDFRLISKVVLEEVNQMDEKSRYLRGMVAWTGFKHDFVDYYRPDREHGTPGYSFRKLITLGMNGFLDFSFFPLRVGFVLGVISIITGSGLMIYHAFDQQINRIAISIRAQDSYWSSVLAYSVGRGHRLPHQRDLEELATSQRGWKDVITEIADAIPSAQVLVLPYDDFGGYPERKLSMMTGLENPPLRYAREWLNRAPSLPELRKALQDRGINPSRLPKGEGRWHPFDRNQTAALREAYADDLYWLRAGADGAATLIEETQPEKMGRIPHLASMTRGQPNGIEERRLARHR